MTFPCFLDKWLLWVTEQWGAGMVICLERGADLHMAQLMPLPLTVCCFSKIQIGFTFLVPAHAGSPRQRAVKWVCVWSRWITYNSSLLCAKLGRSPQHLQLPFSSSVPVSATRHWPACGDAAAWWRSGGSARAVLPASSSAPWGSRRSHLHCRLHHDPPCHRPSWRLLCNKSQVKVSKEVTHSALLCRFNIPPPHTHTQPFNGLWCGTTRVGRYQKKHQFWSSDILYHLAPFTTINGILYYSFYVLDSPLVQPLSRSSLVFLLVLDPQLHTPCISSPNHHKNIYKASLVTRIKWIGGAGVCRWGC